MTLDELITTHHVELYVIEKKAKRHIKIVAVALNAPKNTTCNVGWGATVQQAVDNLKVK